MSVIGLGTWVFGGRWGGADDSDSIAACHAALDAGINWIDTADIYGQHRAERIVGTVLKERGERVIVATKCGVAWSTDPSFHIWREASGDYKGKEGPIRKARALYVSPDAAIDVSGKGFGDGGKAIFWEEINRQAAGSPGGANYGWRILEATISDGSRCEDRLAHRAFADSAIQTQAG